MAVIIDGKALAKKIREQLKEECSKLKRRNTSKTCCNNGWG